MKNIAAYTPPHENDLNASATNKIAKRAYSRPNPSTA